MGNWGSDIQGKVLQPVGSSIQKTELNNNHYSSLPPPVEHVCSHFLFSHSKCGLWTWQLSLTHGIHTENKFQLVFCHWEHLNPSGLCRRDVCFSHNPTGYSQKCILCFPQRSCFQSHTPRELLTTAGTVVGASPLSSWKPEGRSSTFKKLSGVWQRQQFSCCWLEKQHGCWSIQIKFTALNRKSN